MIQSPGIFHETIKEPCDTDDLRPQFHFMQFGETNGNRLSDIHIMTSAFSRLLFVYISGKVWRLMHGQTVKITGANRRFMKRLLAKAIS